MVFGAFDGLHIGHLNFLEQAKKLGDFLIVSVGTDKNVAKIKGRKPLFNQNERLKLISNLKIVDKAVLGSEEDFYNHIKIFSPDVVCLGYDQWAKEEDVLVELVRVGLPKTKVLRLAAYKPGKAKSKITKSSSVDF